MENFVWMWLSITVKDQRVAHNWMGVAVRSCLGVVYANDGMVVSRDSDWLQHLMNVLIGLFRRYGLVDKISKSRTMICQPRALRSGIS